MNIFLSILCFVLGLSILVVAHEWGHFITARLFNVYCYEFSIGFGKKIFRKKMRNKETYFEIGVIPFGGYVSMYGEDDDIQDSTMNNEASLNANVLTESSTSSVEESLNSSENPHLTKEQEFQKEINELNIPKNRSLEGISKPKKAIVMVAGIVMNFILGYVIYFIAASCFPADYYIPTIGQYDTAQTTTFNEQFDALKNKYNLNTDNEFFVFGGNNVYDSNDTSFKTIGSAISTEVYLNDDTTTKYALFGGNLKVNNFNIDYTFYDAKKDGNGDTYYQYHLYKYWQEDDKLMFDSKKSVYSENSSFVLNKMNVTFRLAKATYVKKDGVSISYDKNSIVSAEDMKLSGTLNMNTTTGLLEKTNLSAIKDFQRYLGWEAFGKAGENWANGCGAVFVGLGKLFTGSGWSDAGGIIMMFAQTTIIFETYPFSYYIQIWGLISVNLAIMNLLPFPGLDGWHLLVTCIEGVTRKKLNPKFKRYASAIGMIILFGLMFALVIFDVIRIAGGSIGI